MPSLIESRFKWKFLSQVYSPNKDFDFDQFESEVKENDQFKSNNEQEFLKSTIIRISTSV